MLNGMSSCCLKCIFQCFTPTKCIKGSLSAFQHMERVRMGSLISISNTQSLTFALQNAPYHSLEPCSQTPVEHPQCAPPCVMLLFSVTLPNRAQVSLNKHFLIVRTFGSTLIILFGLCLALRAPVSPSSFLFLTHLVSPCTPVFEKDVWSTCWHES